MKLTEVKPSELSDEVTDYGPIECLNCDFDGHIPISYFLVNSEIETENDFNQLKDFVKEKYGYSSFTEMTYHLGALISATKCPKCNSEEIFQDF